MFLLQIVAAISVVDLSERAGFGVILLAWWVFIFLVGLLCGWSKRTSDRVDFEKIGNGVAALGILFFLVQLTVDGLIPALISMVLWAQAAQNFTLTDRRGLYTVFIITFVLVLYAAAISKSGLFLFILAAYVLAAMFTLYAHYLDQRSELMSVSTESSTKPPIFWPVVSLSFLVLIVSTILYLALPRPTALHYGNIDTYGGDNYKNINWEREIDNPSISRREDETTDINNSADGKSFQENIKKTFNDKNYQGNIRSKQNKGESNKDDVLNNLQKNSSVYRGFTQQCDIFSKSQNSLSNEIIFYLQADRSLYLKGKVFDRFDGRRWTKSNNGSNKLRLNNGVLEFNSISYSSTVNATQIITMAMDYTDTIFFAERMNKLIFPSKLVSKDNYGTLQSPANLKEGTIYSVESKIEYINGRPTSQPDNIGELKRYLELPDNLSDRIIGFASTIVKDEDAPLAKAIMLEQHLRSQYEYTLDTVLDNDVSIPLDNFLFETRRGHCEYFASAMTVMLRTLDIPSRLVTGFSATRHNPITGFYEVKGLDAHAWVEGYFPKYGWVLFEPTAYYDLPSDSETGNVSEKIKKYIDRIASDAKTVEPNSLYTHWLQSWSSVFKTIGNIWHSITSNIMTVAEFFIDWLKSGGLSLIIFSSVVVTFLYFIRHMLIANFRLWQLQNTKEIDVAIKKAFYACETFYASKGYNRQPGSTVTEYYQLLKNEFPNKEPSLLAIAESFTIVRYGKILPAGPNCADIAKHFKMLIRN